MTNGGFSAPRGEVTGQGHRKWLPAPMPSQQPQPAAPSSDHSHHIPSPRIFFPMTASSRIIKERYFLIVSPLPLVTVLHNQGNQQAFTLSLDFFCSIFKHWFQNNPDFHTKEANCGFFNWWGIDCEFPSLGKGKRQVWYLQYLSREALSFLMKN